MFLYVCINTHIWKNWSYFIFLFYISFIFLLFFTFLLLFIAFYFLFVTFYFAYFLLFLKIFIIFHFSLFLLENWKLFFCKIKTNLTSVHCFTSCQKWNSFSFYFSSFSHHDLTRAIIFFPRSLPIIFLYCLFLWLCISSFCIFSWFDICI